VLGLVLGIGDSPNLPCGRVAWGIIELLSFARFCQIPVAVNVHIQVLAIADQPDAELRLRSEDDEAVLGFVLVGGLLGDLAVDPAEVGRARWGRTYGQERQRW